MEGGLYSGEITELCGAPGVGKTQVSINIVCLLHGIATSQ